MIHVVLPYHLRTLAQAGIEVEIEIGAQKTISSILDTLEARYPMLRGTIRDQITQDRRPFLRFFACGVDLSLEPLNTVLPEEVVQGIQPFRIVGAMAGG